MAKIESFEKYANLYDEWFDKHNSIYEDELKTIKKLVDSHINGLDIGCGSGRFAIPLNIQTGVEPSKQMRELAKDKGLKVFDNIAEQLPFKDETFDFAIMITTICFLDNPLKALKEANRVIKKDGFLIIGFIDKDSIVGKKYHFTKKESKFYNDATFYSASEVIVLSESADFSYGESMGVESTDNGFVFMKFIK